MFLRCWIKKECDGVVHGVCRGIRSRTGDVGKSSIVWMEVAVGKSRSELCVEVS